MLAALEDMADMSAVDHEDSEDGGRQVPEESLQSH